jgi:hypothetical protein
MRLIFLVRMLRRFLVDDRLDLGSLCSHGTLTFPRQYKSTRVHRLINAVTVHVDFHLSDFADLSSTDRRAVRIGRSGLSPENNFADNAPIADLLAPRVQRARILTGFGPFAALVAHSLSK